MNNLVEGITNARSAASEWPFVKLLLGLVIAILLGTWLSTSIVYVELGEVAIHQRFGKSLPRLLTPGMHLVLPRPFSHATAVNTKRINTVSIGFDAKPEDLSLAPLLWTRPHGKEYAMVVGDGTEVAVVNALVHFKVKEDSQAVRQFAFSTQRPASIVRAIAHQTIQDRVSGNGAAELLSLNRDAFENDVRAELQTQLDQMETGVQIVGFRLLGIHPPVEVAAAYLDVVSATIDAERDQEVSRKNAAGEILRCEMMAATDIADATAAGLREKQRATERRAKYDVMQQLHMAGPYVTRWSLFNQTLRSALENQPLVLLDKDLPKNSQIWLNDQQSPSPQH